MSHEWLKKRQTRYTAYVAVYIVVILAVLTGVNFLANRYDKSWDSTANKQFSLADQTIKVVKGLNRDVHITYFDETSRFRRRTTAGPLFGAFAQAAHRLHRSRQEAAAGQAAGFRRDVNILVNSGLRTEEAKTSARKRSPARSSAR